MAGGQAEAHKAIVCEYVGEGPDGVISLDANIWKLQVGFYSQFSSENSICTILQIEALILWLIRVDDSIVEGEVEHIAIVNEKLINLCLGGTWTSGVCSIITGCNCKHKLLVVVGRVLTYNLKGVANMRAEPVAHM